jgi:hypothetical protein
MKFKKIFTPYLVIVALLVTVITPAGCTIGKKDPLTTWNDTAIKQDIIQFVKDVTTEGSQKFVPAKDRVATFDMDGTIVAEMIPWLEMAVTMHRIQSDLSSDTELVNECEQLKNIIFKMSQSEQPSNTGEIITSVTTKAFAGMTPDETAEYVHDFMKNPDPAFENLTYEQSFYKPMIELINYLQASKFNVYIVSGTERSVIWGITQDVLSLPRSNMIGADANLNVKGQDNLKKYVLKNTDKIVRGVGHSNECSGLDKAIHIEREVGIKPILAFGNTDGDFSMLNYAVSNSYEHRAYLLQHDDVQREYFYNDGAQPSWNAEADRSGWQVVSMKNEFKQVFMVENTKKLLPYFNESSVGVLKESSSNTSSKAA